MLIELVARAAHRRTISPAWIASAALAIGAVALTVRLVMQQVYVPVSPWVAALTLMDAEMGRNLSEGRGWVANRQVIERATMAQRDSTRHTMVDLQDVLPVDDGVAGNWISPGAAHSPGYSVWFALSYWLGGDYRYVHSQRMQAVLDSLAAVLVFAIGCRCWSVGAGIIGGMLYAVSPPHAFLGNLTVAAATDSFWFLLAAYGGVVAIQATLHGRRPFSGVALVVSAAFAGASMNSTAMLLPAVLALALGVLALRDRRLWRAVVAMLVAQLIVLAALTPWALRNQRVYGQFSLVRGSFWQLAFAAWGELPNPWGLGFDDKEFWHWIDENCPGCNSASQQLATRDFLVHKVVLTAPFGRHIAHLIRLRLPRLLAVAETPEGVLSTNAPRSLQAWFSAWNRSVPIIALLAAVGLLIASLNTESRWGIWAALGPTIFLTAFSLMFYVELRKTVPGYGFVFALAGIAVATLLDFARRLSLRRFGFFVQASAVTLYLATFGVGRVRGQFVAAGGELDAHVVTRAGDVWGWGNDLYGQLGDGRQLSRYAVAAKVKAKGLQDVSWVASGSNHTLAVTRDGAVWAWGDNHWGQISADATLRVLEPRLVAFDAPVASVSGGYVHSLALDRSGQVWAWGSNLYGQLGTGDYKDRQHPTLVKLPRRMRNVSAGWFFSLAVDDTGHVWGWGNNERGQLGNSNLGAIPVPRMIEGLEDIVSVVSGHQHAVALRSDGSVWSWGANDYGQVGVPLRDGQRFARATAGRLTAGELAYGDLELLRQTSGPDANPGVRRSPDFAIEWRPQRVPGVPVAMQVASEADSSLMLTASGEVWAWGDNLYGQLGDGTFETRNRPVPIGSLPPVVSLGTGGHAHAVAIAVDGAVWTWGFGHYGQLGGGVTERRRGDPRKIENFRLVEPSLDLRPSEALLLNASQMGWVERGVIFEGSHLVIKNKAAGQFTYAAVSNPVEVGPSASFSSFFAQGVVRSGGITIGIQVDERWVYQVNLTEGPFTVTWEPSKRLRAVAVIAHNLSDASLTSDIEVTAWGWRREPNHP